MANYEEYAWIVVLGALMAFFMAYGIGANDVANAFATSVGSKTLTLFQATILAGIFEFLGALLLGRGVTDTIRKGIVERDVFEDSPEILMYGMFCALCAAGIWLIVATYFEMPVSTTHSIIGGLVGMALVAYGRNAVVWHEIDTSKAFPIKGISSVVISWVFSPVASGIVAAIFFFAARTFILRDKDSYNRAFYFLPMLVGIAAFVNAFYVLDKGITKQWKWLKDQKTKASAWIAACIAAVAILIGVGFSYWLKKKVDEQIKNGTLAADLEAAGTDKPEAADNFFGKMAAAINSNDPHAAVKEDEEVAAMHARAEVFKPETEEVFRYLQVLTSCCDAFAHGANDVANSIGPFSAIWHVYKKQALTKKSDVPIWILVIGGAGIVIGLATYGYSIIKAIGVKLTKITPSRGFSIEMGSALIVVTGSYLGLPLSTTHCQVGATAFVGLLEGTGGISYKVMLKTVFGWIFTLIIVGAMSALLMVLGIRTPSIRGASSLNSVEAALVEGGANTSRNIEAVCGPSESLSNTGKYFNYFSHNFRFRDLVGNGVEYMNKLNMDLSAADGCPAAWASGVPAPPDAVLVEEETKLLVTDAENVASAGPDALAEYLDECEDPGLVNEAAYTKFFAAFVDADGKGIVHQVPGAPTTALPDALDIVGALEDAVEEGTCDAPDITKTDAYKVVFPKATAAARRL